MEPFIYLADYRIVICKTCRVGYTGQEVQSHLRTSHSSTTSTEERRQIVSTVAQVVGLIQRQERPRGLCVSYLAHRPYLLLGGA